MLEEALQGLPDLATLEPDPHGRRGHLYDPETGTAYHVGAEVIAEFNRLHKGNALADMPDKRMLQAAREAANLAAAEETASQETEETASQETEESQTSETAPEAGAKKGHAGK